MKAPLLTVFFAVTWLLACQDEKPDWSTVEISPTENFPAIDSSRWSYPWYMILYEGSFESILGDTILATDTVPLIHNSTCATNTWPDTLPFCKAILKDKRLEVEIYHEGPDGYGALKIWVFGHKFKGWYESMTPVPGTEYFENEFEDQRLTLSTIHWEKGATIKGKVQFYWNRTYPSGKILKESIRGNFEAVIE